MAGNWWTMLLRGLVAIAFAIVAWARPGHTLAILIVALGAYLVADGVVALVHAAGRADQQDASWITALEGILGLVLGLYTLARPAVAMAVVFLVIAVWAVSTGVLEIVEAFRLRRSVYREWLLAASGFLRLAFGIALFAMPRAAALTLLWIAAAYALVDGIVLILLSFRRRRLDVRRERRAGPPMTPQPA